MNSLLGQKLFPTLSFWRVNLFSWLLVGTISFLAKLYYYPTLVAGFCLFLLHFILALSLSSLLREVYRRTSLKDFFELKTMLLVLAGSLVAAVVQAEIVQRIAIHLGWNNPQVPTRFILIYRVELIWGLYMAWGIGYYGLKAKIRAYHEMQRRRETRAEARNLELQLLRNRIDPHFLFNSLNGIAAEIAPHPEAAAELIRNVSDYLRFLLDHREIDDAPLAAEIDAMTSYLKIEKARFGDRLQTSMDSTRAARRTRVPNFLLQPLVENAIKHADWSAATPVRITIRASKEDDTLTLLVTNNGTLKDDLEQGVGLSTLRRLLELQYPGRNRFTLAQHHGTVSAELILEGTPCSAS
jgi:signal transduction histidine kinase